MFNVFRQQNSPQVRVIDFWAIWQTPICVIIFAFIAMITFGTLEFPKYYIFIAENLENI